MQRILILTNRDSFVGGYVAELLAQKRGGEINVETGQWDIEAGIAYGCKASARVIEAIGCLDPIAWADEVDIPRRPPKVIEPEEF